MISSPCACAQPSKNTVFILLQKSLQHAITSTKTATTTSIPVKIIIIPQNFTPKDLDDSRIDESVKK